MSSCRRWACELWFGSEWESSHLDSCCFPESDPSLKPASSAQTQTREGHERKQHTCTHNKLIFCSSGLFCDCLPCFWLYSYVAGALAPVSWIMWTFVAPAFNMLISSVFLWRQVIFFEHLCQTPFHTHPDLTIQGRFNIALPPKLHDDVSRVRQQPPPSTA